MNISVFGKTKENIRKFRNIKLVTTKKGKYYLVSKPNCHTTKQFSKILLRMKIGKKATAKIIIKKVYDHLSVLGNSIFEYNKTV